MNQNYLFWQSLVGRDIDKVLLISNGSQNLFNALSEYYTNLKCVEVLDFSLEVLDSCATSYDLIVVDRSLKKLLDQTGSDVFSYLMKYLSSNGALILLENNRLYYKGLFSIKNDQMVSIAYMRNLINAVRPAVSGVYLSRFCFNDGLTPLPEIYNIHSIYRDQKVVGDFSRGFKEKLLYTGIGRYFWAGALLCLRKVNISFFDELINSDPFFSRKSNNTCTIQRLIAGNFGVQVVIFSDREGNQYVLRFFLSPESVKYSKINSAALKRFKGMVPGLMLPGLVSESSFDGFEYTIENKVRGKEVIYLGRRKSSVFRYANEKWFEFQLSQSTLYDSDYIGKSVLEPLFSDLIQIYSGKKELISSLQRSLMHISVKSDCYRLMPAHGDYKLGNILFEGDVAVSLIDWDHSFDNSLPLYDQLTFVLYYLSKTKQMEICEVYKTYLLPWDVDNYISQYFSELLDRLNINNEQFEFLRITFWLLLLVKRFGDTRTANAVWVSSMIDGVLITILDRLRYESP